MELGRYSTMGFAKNSRHKTFDGDGVLVVAGGYATLQDLSGKE